MLYLTKLFLQNYCGFEHNIFDFKKPDGTPYKYICFYGPNGDGKSTVLEAISLLTANQTGRDPENIRRSLLKYVKNKDYVPSYERISGHSYKNNWIEAEKENFLPEMIIEGTYFDDETQKTYIVRLSQNGFERNDFTSDSGPWGDDHLQYRQRIAHFVTSDSDLSMSKFQLRKNKMKIFEEITARVMRFPTECTPPTGLVPIDEEFSTDFILHKRGDRIHYKRMSAGERKIVKSFSQLLNLIHDLENPEMGEPEMQGWPRLLLIDNVEMHIYYDRHIEMTECLKKYFSDQQIFVTTHSGVLIPRFECGENDTENELMINLESAH